MYLQSNYSTITDPSCNDILKAVEGIRKVNVGETNFWLESDKIDMLLDVYNNMVVILKLDQGYSQYKLQCTHWIM